MDSRYLDRKQAIDRLVNEWRTYGKIIIAYDFDDTVFDYHNRGDTFNKVIELLREVRNDAYFIVFTACNESQYDDIRKYLIENDIPYDAINQNAPFVNFSGRKVYYNIFLDDRAGLDSAYNQLALAFFHYKEDDI